MPLACAFSPYQTHVQKKRLSKKTLFCGKINVNLLDQAACLFFLARDSILFNFAKEGFPVSA